MIKKFPIVLDIRGFNSKVPPIQLVSGDTKAYEFDITLIDTNTAVDLTNHTVKLTFKKSDGTTVFQDAAIVDATSGKISIQLDSQVIACIGLVEAEANIYDASSGRITSVTFGFIVLKGLLDDSTVESQNEFTSLTTALNQTQQWNNQFAAIYPSLDQKYSTTLNNINSQISDIVTVKTVNDLINILSNSGVSNKIISLASNQTFALSSLLNITNAQNIIIEGNGATIDGELYFEGNYATNIIFRNINFITSQNIDFVKFVCDMNNITFEKCTFEQDSTSYGSSDSGLIYFNCGTGNINGLTIKSCDFTSNANTNFKVAVKLYNSGTSTAQNVSIYDCNFDSFNGFGIESNCLMNSSISNCRFYQNANVSSSGAMSLINCNNVSISNCGILNCYSGIEATGTSISIDTCYFNGTIGTWNILLDNTSSNIFIDNCRFFGGSVGVHGTSITITNLNIDNCKFYSGSFIQLVQTINGILLTDCHFNALNASLQYFWTSVNATLTGACIKNNIIDTTGLSNTTYCFRFDTSQDKEQIQFIDNLKLGTYGLSDLPINTDELQYNTQKYNTIGYTNKTNINKASVSISNNAKGFTLILDPNSTGGIPRGFIKIYCFNQLNNDPATYGEYRIPIGTYSAMSVLPSSSIVNSTFGDLTVSASKDSNSKINLAIVFGTPANITTSLKILLEFYGMGEFIIYRGISEISK